jgi:succinate dehydrogenase hydrophobic anchor subunit
MTSRKYLVSVVFISLLIWGPMDHSWPSWLAIRISYLILIPVIVWFLLKWIWRIWKPSEELEDRLIRALASATSGVLLVLAILELMSDTHIGNTMWIQTRDGSEAVGDDIILRGPDWVAAIILFFLCAISFGYSISRREEKK